MPDLFVGFLNKELKSFIVKRKKKGKGKKAAAKGAGKKRKKAQKDYGMCNCRIGRMKKECNNRSLNIYIQ